MAFLVLIIAGVILTAAVRNTHGELMGAIRQDVPAYAIWAAAIFGVAMIGFIPGLKPVSRGLLALVVLAIVLGNYRQILAGFQGVAYGAQAQAVGGGASQGGAQGSASAMASVERILSTIGSGGSADYSNLFGPSGPLDFAARAHAEATKADQAAFNSQRSV